MFDICSCKCINKCSCKPDKRIPASKNTFLLIQRKAHLTPALYRYPSRTLKTVSTSTPNAQAKSMNAMPPTSSDRESEESSFGSADSWRDDSAIVTDSVALSSQNNVEKRNRVSISKVASLADRNGVSAAATAAIATATLEAHGS